MISEQKFIETYNRMWKEGCTSTRELANELGISLQNAYNKIGRIREKEKFIGRIILKGKLTQKSQDERKERDAD